MEELGVRLADKEPSGAAATTRALSCVHCGAVLRIDLDASVLPQVRPFVAQHTPCAGPAG